MLLKSLKLTNSSTILFMSGFFFFFILFLSGFLQFPSISTSINSISDPGLSAPKSAPDPFTDLLGAFRKWDSQVGCARFREKHKAIQNRATKNGSSSSSSLQEADGESECGGEAKTEHVSVLVKGWTWIPDNLDNLYSCACGLSCLWTKSPVLADKPDALLFETTSPPFQ